jgi:nucleotide-binding universal stress UspA family protein
MYQTIMVPVDLAHADKLDKALSAAADLAKLYHATVHVVGVTAAAPSEVAHNPKEFADKLAAFAADQSDRLGIEIAAKATVSHDPTRDLDDALAEVGRELGADLVVMASHVPGFMDHFFSSNAGWLAVHEDISVFVVR